MNFFFKTNKRAAFLWYTFRRLEKNKTEKRANFRVEKDSCACSYLWKSHFHPSVFDMMWFIAWICLLHLGFLMEQANCGITYTFSSPTALFNFATQTIHGPKSGDKLVLQNGIYHDTAPEADMVMSNGKTMTRVGYNGISWGWTIRNSGFTIRAETPGGVVWSPPEPGIFIQYDHGADNNIFTGFQFKSGFAQESYNIFDVWGNNNTFSHLYFGDMTATSYVRFGSTSKGNIITHSNFEYKPQSVSGPIISMETSEMLPGYHKIRYSNFYHMPDRIGTLDVGNANIRIGDEFSRTWTSRCIVEYCVFNATMGASMDTIIVSSRENVLRYNTFSYNQGAMITVQQADFNVIYSNYFIYAGGISVNQCNNTYIYNNYFHHSGDSHGSWPLVQANFDQDRLNMMVYYNTFVESSSIHFGSSIKLGNGVVYANNVFRKAVNGLPTNLEGNLFLGNTAGVTMYNNMYYGTLNSGVAYCGEPCGCDESQELCDVFPLGNKFKRTQMTNADPHLSWDATLNIYIPSSPDSPAIAEGEAGEWLIYDIPGNYL